MSTTNRQTDQIDPVAHTRFWMARSYTPGPWRIQGITDANSVDISIYAETVVHHNPKWLARVYGEGVLSRDTGTRNANARLIAAAPELLAALKLVLDAFDYAQSGREYPNPERIAAARAALAKAEGRDV